MANQQTDCHWAIELLAAAAIFVAGIAVVGVGYARTRTDNVAVALLGGLPAVISFVIGCRVGSAALRKRRSASNPPQVEGDEEDGTLPGIAVAAHDDPQWRQQHPGCIQLPAIAIAQLRELSPDKAVDGGAEECAICLGKIGGDGVPTRQLPACGHVLHKDCIEQWLRVHPTCPICRSNVPRDSPQVVLGLNT